MWVARDKDGYLCLYTVKPVRDTERDGTSLDNWVYPDGDEYLNCDYISLDESQFPKLKWEDEPLEVELVVKGRVEELIEYICKQNMEIRELKNENKRTV